MRRGEFYGSGTKNGMLIIMKSLNDLKIE